jgi:D-glycero-beta-D-manno-heptose 1-phosphate adenylyltransferase
MDKLELTRNKIYDRPQLLRKLALWRFEGKRIVFTNGCFDILHLGHVEYLAQAAGLGDVLIVAVNTDASVAGNKGPNRPLNNQLSRTMALASMFFVNAVILFDEETPYDLISIIRPDVLVKGGDYELEKIAGNDIVKSYGGEVTTIALVPGYSTTAVEKKIINSSK